MGCVNGTSLNNITGDPLLDPAGLQDNGGKTQTIALQVGSPAIDAGDNALAVDADGNPLAYDQRGAGFPRIINGTVDIGAFEATVSSSCLNVAPGDVYGLINAINTANGSPEVTTICLSPQSYYPIQWVDNYTDGPHRTAGHHQSDRHRGQRLRDHAGDGYTVPHPRHWRVRQPDGNPLARAQRLSGRRQRLRRRILQR